MMCSAETLGQTDVRSHGGPPIAAVHRRPVILFAFCQGDERTAALRRAADLSRTLEWDLVVTCVLPILVDEQVEAFMSDRAASVRPVDRKRIAERYAIAWIAAVLGDGAASRQVDVRGGAFVPQVAARANELGASLIVVPDWESGTGSVVSRLAQAALGPVLVGRDDASSGAILAATDLEDPDLPVVRYAADLGQRLNVPVIAVHNVKPILSVPGGDAFGTAPATTTAGLTEIRSDLMRKGVRGAAINAEAVVATECRADDAILRAARRRHADLIAVGCRPRSWLGHLVVRSVSEQVVDRAHRSVLVIPLIERPRMVKEARARSSV